MSRPVHIAMSVHNGARYIAEQVQSIQAQSHDEWTLWIRDDGSTDATVQVLHDLAAVDRRIRVHPPDGCRLGTTLCHDWLLSRLPDDAEYIFSCDADDVWLPDKMERSLTALRAEEQDRGGAILLHTDLAIVDAALNPLAPSLWEFNGTNPEATELPRLAVSNVATGPTLVFNRTLLDEVLPIPSHAIYHDWWIALVAAAVGHIVALADPTVLYRRHDSNVTTVTAGHLGTARQALQRLAGAPSRTATIKHWVVATARQAEAFLGRFEDRLEPRDVERLRDLASLPNRGTWGRKLGILKHHTLPERGVVRNLGLVLRG